MTSRAAGRSHFRLQASVDVANPKETAKVGTEIKVMMLQGLKYIVSRATPAANETA